MFRSFTIINRMNLKKLLAIPVLVVGLLIVVQLSRSIINIYGRGGRAGELAAEVAGLEEEKKALEEEQAFRQTPEFVEREARDKLRMVKEGERILVLPDSKISADAKQDERGIKSGAVQQVNWKRWIDYWLR